MSIYFAQKKKLSVTINDCEKVFDKVDHTLFWQQLTPAKITGNLLGVIQNLYQKSKAWVNGGLTDVFDCNIGVRQGDNLSLLFIIFLNDLNNLIRTCSNDICLNPAQFNDLTTLLKMHALLYADDTL